jgi:hypothetical protein
VEGRAVNPWVAAFRFGSPGFLALLASSEGAHDGIDHLVCMSPIQGHAAEQEPVDEWPDEGAHGRPGRRWPFEPGGIGSSLEANPDGRVTEAVHARRDVPPRSPVS